MVDKFINVDLIRHPMNWAIVLLMVMIGGAALHFACRYVNEGQTETTVAAR